MLAILAAAAMTCSAQLPFGGETHFRLTIAPQTVTMDMGGGNVRRMRRLDRGPLVTASANIADDASTSIMVDQRGRFQQTFLSPDTGVVFVYGVCRK